MGTDTLIEAVRQMLWISMVLSLPVLGVALAVGLVIGLLQAVTSIQEQTLSFIPKLVGIILVLILLGSWMTNVMVKYSEDVIGGIARYGKM